MYRSCPLCNVIYVHQLWFIILSWSNMFNFSGITPKIIYAYWRIPNANNNINNPAYHIPTELKWGPTGEFLHKYTRFQPT